MRRQLGQALIAIGLFGFFTPFFLMFAGTSLDGTWLDSFELPIFFQTNTIVLPDGGRLTATWPIQRVQRYGSDGRFRTGWFVDAKGGEFAIGLTNDGKVAICTGRGRQIFLYDLNGQPVGQQPCFGGPREIPKLLQPIDFPAGKINLQPVMPAEPPIASLAAILLIPFLHPFVALSIVAVGYLVRGLPILPPKKLN